MLWKTAQKTLTCFFQRRDDSSETVPSTNLAELVDSRPPTLVGEQTSQESASTDKQNAKI